MTEHNIIKTAQEMMARLSTKYRKEAKGIDDYKRLMLRLYDDNWSHSIMMPMPNTMDTATIEEIREAINTLDRVSKV
jgi:hypothetical protein